jgi:ribulose-phosphate 3-epimerase
LNSSFLQSIKKGSTAVGPSVLSSDFTRLAEEIGAVEEAGADFHHLDIMDGHFVPNITFGPMVVEAISRAAGIPLVTHLMISDPARYAADFVRAGSDIVSFHYEAVAEGHKDIAGIIREAGAAPGLAINPDTPLRSVAHLLGDIDLLLIMTVFPGFGGQKFIIEGLDKIREAVAVRDAEGHSFVIEVDGGIKPDNAGAVREAGGECLVAGTAVYRSGDYGSAIKAIRG